MPSAERWPRVSRTYPCPICQKADWCQVSPDGAIAGCMRVVEGAFKARDLASGATCYYHRLAGDAPPPGAARPAPRPATAALHDIARVRALYATLAVHCAAALPDDARQDLARRFGRFADEVIARWGIGYCPVGAWLPLLLQRSGHRGLGRQAGVLTPGGTTVSSLAGRLVIPYRRGGQVCDLRGRGSAGAGTPASGTCTGPTGRGGSTTSSSTTTPSTGSRPAAPSTSPAAPGRRSPWRSSACPPSARAARGS